MDEVISKPYKSHSEKHTTYVYFLNITSPIHFLMNIRTDVRPQTKDSVNHIRIARGGHGSAAVKLLHNIHDKVPGIGTQR